MKITTLLTQYLYTHHRLDLPGIGSFFLDPAVSNLPENTKQRNAVLEGISFKSDSNQKESPELIAYISAQSGKMKALASSDLESHIQLVQQFLNIGKPFSFDGIGTLVKVKQGEYEFIPLAITADKLKEYSTRETSKTAQKEEAGTKKYESFLSEPKPKEGWRKPVVALMIIAGLALAVWGGYAISKKSAGPAEPEVAEQQPEPSILIPASDTMPQVTADTNTTVTPAKPASPGDNYKYVLEVAQSKRAFKRYNQLRTNLWKVELETADSVNYKLVLRLPALNSDTTRVLDSLTAFLGRRVYIEHKN